MNQSKRNELSENTAATLERKKALMRMIELLDRASEEWDKVRGEHSISGNEWNYYTNEEGLLRYWEDALKRSGKYENIITIGMWGERDSSMLGEDATLEENISLLKKIIKNQRALIGRHVPRKAKELLALYKEVEAYFYGDETTQGLGGAGGRSVPSV